MFTENHVLREKAHLSSGIPLTVSKLLLLFLLIVTTAYTSFADCGCDYTVPGGQHVTDGKALGLGPGDVICLKAGTNYGNLKFVNIVGSASNPIIIKNCGGQVTISANASFSLKTEKSRYFRITGSGSSDYYGIVLKNANSIGLTLDILSTDFEVDRLEIANVGFAGIMAKTDPKCGEPYDRSKFTMQNIKLHHNYIHDTDGEGIYVGNSFYAKGVSTSCGQLMPHAIKNAKIYSNIVKRTGWDGIQVGSATDGCEIYNNTVEDYGIRKNAPQNNGLQIGEGTTGPCFNNVIKNGHGNGMIVLGKGDNVIFNNLIINPGEHGAFIDARPPATTGSGFKFFNNTVISPGKDGVRIYATQSGLYNQVKNNLIVGGDKAVALLHSGVTNTSVSNNYQASSVSEVKFVNPSAGDYQLTSASPCIDKGANVMSYGVTFGLGGSSRPSGSALDLGAYEYSGSGGSSSNKPPTVDAGSDKTLTLPDNSISLTASASDPDGNIASYDWSKTSGPSATLKNATSQKLDVSNLSKGTYVFSVTVKDNSGASASDEVKVNVNDALQQDPPSPAPTPSTGDNGLTYSYYEGSWNSLPNFNNLSAKKRGTISNFSLSPRSRSDYFGFTFEGYIDIKSSGKYTFYTTSDDGSELYIDGSRVVNNNGLHAVQEKSGSIQLNEGLHAIRVVFFEKTGKERLDVRYAGPGVSKRTIPSDVLFQSGGSSQSQSSDNGLNYSYYTGSWSSLPNFSSLSAKKKGTVSNFSLSPRSQNDNFGFKFEGYIDIKSSGKYTFYTSSDDGSALYINGSRVVNNNGTHSAQEKSGSIELSKGMHAIRVIYFERTGNEQLNVKYAGPGVSKRSIPNDVLFRSRNNARTASSDIAKPTNLLDEVLGSDSISVSAYPSPVSDKATISINGISEESLNLNVVDVLGRSVHTQSSIYDGMELNVDKYIQEVGLFYLVVEGDQGYHQVIKMIKE